MLKSDKCVSNCIGPDCNSYGEDLNGLPICIKYSVPITSNRGVVRKKYQVMVSEINAIQKENQAYLHELLQKYLNKERLTDREKEYIDLFIQFSSTRLDLVPWLEDGCLSIEEDKEALNRFSKLFNMIKSYLEIDQDT